MDYGVYIWGRFCGSEVRRGQRNQADEYTVLGVAVGMASVPVYCDDVINTDHLNWGDEVLIRCRPYVSKNGRLSYTGGVLVDQRF